jgi:hypothetical protein
MYLPQFSDEDDVHHNNQRLYFKSFSFFYLILLLLMMNVQSLLKWSTSQHRVCLSYTSLQSHNTHIFHSHMFINVIPFTETMQQPESSNEPTGDIVNDNSKMLNDNNAWFTVVVTRCSCCYCTFSVFSIEKDKNQKMYTFQNIKFC